MKLIIHDLEKKQFEKIFNVKSEEVMIIDDTKKIRKCIGCFSCLVKTPGKCILNDEFVNIAEELGKSSEVVIITKSFYGSYSPFIKNVLDRSLGYFLPSFKKINSNYIHESRYKNNFSLRVYFYGEVFSVEKKEFCEGTVKLDSETFRASDYKISFFNKANEMGGIL